MKTHLRLLFILTPLGLGHAAWAQVGVGTTAPDAKSALDIRATDKGLLIPRLTAAQRTAITSPPQGLMVYQTDGTASGGAQTGFWYYAGQPAQWVFLNPTPGGGGLTLPYTATTSVTSPAFSITNTAFDGPALEGVVTNDDTPAVKGRNTSATGTLGIGVQGLAAGGTGVLGASSAGGTGVLGESGSGAGLVGTSLTGVAVKGSRIRAGERGRAAEFINAAAGNDSTALYISTVGPRPALRAVSTAASSQAAIRGVKQAGTDASAVEGVITSGTSGQSAGVLGYDKSTSSTSSGVLGLTTGGYAVRGIASGSGGFGVAGSATDSYGVIGSSQSGTGVYGSSTATVNSVAGVLGTNNAGAQSVGVLGTTTIGYGVRGVASANGGYGVAGTATDSYGVYGGSTSGNGVYGSSTSSSGVEGSSTSAAGVRGVSSANLASTGGVLGVNNGGTQAVGVLGTSTGGTGVRGVTGAGNSGGLAGVVGVNTNSSGIGVLGQTTSGYGVRGEATGTSGYGVTGVASSTNGIGVLGSATGAATGITGQASGTGRAGYFTQSNSSYTGNALEVQNASLGPTTYLNQSNVSNTEPVLHLENVGSGPSLLLTSTRFITGAASFAGTIDFNYGNTKYAEIYSFAGPFVSSSLVLNSKAPVAKPGSIVLNALGVQVSSPMQVQDNLSVTGTLSKGGGSFKIDHPLDPENQYLYHSFVESPDMLNVYNGNVTLDARGEATVQLPDYFQALNRDFRYQLTSLGAFMPVFVQEQVADNRFRIAGGTPGGEVSWQVTGIRQDKWANQNRIPNAAPKESENRGKYLHPAAYSLPAARGIGYQPVAPPAPTANRSAAPGQLNDAPAATLPATRLRTVRHE